MSLTGSARVHHCESLNLNCYWVCVVVVELAGTAGTAGVVVVVVVVEVGAAGVVQLDSNDAMATAAKHAMISFFISIIMVWFVVLQAHNYVIGWS
jgi:hypothetical protein